MITRFNNLEWALILTFGFLTGCAYAWKEGQKVNYAEIHKVETEVAMDFCSKLLGGVKRGCAIRLTNTDNGITRCVMVVLPNDPEAIVHESGHCMGQDH